MRRLHLLEIEDQPWCPRAVRDGVTDYLRFAIAAGRAYAPVVALLAESLRAARARRVVDLCAGAGGPWESLVVALRDAGAPVEVLLTDAAPNAEAFRRAASRSGGGVRGEPRPVDARRVPADVAGFRTIFSAVHHFRPAEARAVLADAAARGEGIAAFEATHRSEPALLVTLLLVPLLVLVATPAIRPFRWSRLLLTYLLPAIPFVALWDGLVSCLRTYTPDELRALTRGLDGLIWEAGELRAAGPVPVTYLVGVPMPASSRGEGAARAS